MATHDYVIDNSTGANVRSDINSVLQAILTNNSSSSAPSTTAAYMWWADTTTGILKIRNSANDGWVELLQLDGTLTLEDGSASTPALAFRDDLNTGIFSSAADTFNVATGGVERMELGTATVFNEDGADVDFRIEGDTQGNLFYVDAGNDRVGIGTGTPDTLLNIKGTDTAYSGGVAVGAIFQGEDGSGRKVQLVAPGSVGEAGVGTPTNHSLTLFTANTERIRIDTSGNVGIGTSSPSRKLDVVGDSEFIHDNGITIEATSTNTAGQLTIIGVNNSNQVSAISRIKSVSTDSSSAATATTFSNRNSGNVVNEHMRIDSSGNVGIGTTSLSDKFTIGDGDLKFFHSTAGSAHRTTFIEFGNSSNRITSESNFGSEGSSGYTAGYKFTTKNFDGSAFEDIMALGIQARGHVLFGQSSADTAATGARISAISQNPAASYMYRGDAGVVMIFGGGGGSGQVLLDFRHGGTGIGSVSKNGTSNVSYNTSSDYRLKENIVDLTGAITRIKTLQPKRFNWISDQTNTLQDGFLAHEVTAVPEAITGTKDAVVTQAMLDSGQVEEMSVGDPIYQQIDQSKLVPLLVAAVQELITKVETLEAA